MWPDAEGHPTGHGIAGAGGYNLELPLIVTGVRASLGSCVEELSPYPQALRVSKLAMGGGKGMQEPFLFSLNSRHVPFPWLSPLGLHSLPCCSQVYTCA